MNSGLGFKCYLSDVLTNFGWGFGFRVFIYLNSTFLYLNCKKKKE